MKVEIGDSPVLRAADSLVTIVALGDFECPFCSRADATLVQHRGRIQRGRPFV